MTRWLTLTLLSSILLLGCFRDHDRDGEEPGCEMSSTEGLVCPERVIFGDPITFSLTHAYPGCCSGGEERVDITRDGDTFNVRASFCGVECPDEDLMCLALSPRASGRHSVEVDAPGIYTIDTGWPISGSCVIEVVEEEPPGCETSFTDSLSCPATARAGEPFNVELSHYYGGCCSGGRAEVDVRTDGSRSTIATRFCDVDPGSCCEECACISPVGMERVSVTARAPGLHTIRAGDFSCEVLIEDRDDLTCNTIDSNVIAPSTVLAGQPYIATLRASGAGCGCTPGVSGSRLEVCDCCTDCFCADDTYEQWISRDLPPGMNEVEVGGLTLPVNVVDGDTCRPTMIDRVELLRPRGDGGDQPQQYWAEIHATQFLCCVSPSIAARRDGDRVEVLSCVQGDCDCIGEPTPTRTFFPLGTEPTGDVTVAGQRLTW